jgi:hypothetical protein
MKTINSNEVWVDSLHTTWSHTTEDSGVRLISCDGHRELLSPILL